MAIDFLKGLFGFLFRREQPVDETKWIAGGVEIHHLPLVEAKSRLRQSREASDEPVSWLGLKWDGYDVSFTYDGKPCLFESFQQETHTNVGTRKKHRPLWERSRSFPAELLANLTNRTSQLQVTYLKDGTLGVTIYKRAYHAHTSFDQNAHIWLDPKTLQGIYIEEEALDCSV